MISNINYETETNVETKIVNYIGVAALTEGMTVAYIRDSLLGVRNDTQAAADFGSGRYRCVDVLSLANIEDFAGVVASGGGCAADANRTNAKPVQICIVVPKEGIAVNVHTNLSCTINVTIFRPVVGQYYASRGPLLAPWAFKAIQTIDRSGTAGIVEAVFIRAGIEDINPHLNDTVQMYDIGQRYVDPATGNVYRYSKVGVGGVTSEFGAVNIAPCLSSHIPPTQGTGIGVLGGYTAKITVSGSDGFAGDGVIAADELVGGYVWINNGTSEHPQRRRITANTVAASNLSIVTVDRPLTSAVSTAGGSSIEVFANPYAHVVDGNVANNAYASVVGMACIEAAAGTFVWLQTRGPCWITSDANTGKTANSRMLYFGQNGAVTDGHGLTYAGHSYQPAGYAMDLNTGSVSNSPLCMLMLE